MRHFRLYSFYAATALTSLSLLAALPAHASDFTDALEAAYAHNPRIAAERARQEATDEGVAQALSNTRPNVNANYQVGKQRTAVNDGNDTNTTYRNEELSLTQPLFRGGGTWASYHSAKQRVLAGQYRLSSLEQQVLLDAITAYMDVVQANAILDLAKNNQEVLEKQLKASQERFKVGEVTRTDVAQSEARLSGAKSEVISAQGQLTAANAAFERVVGHKPERVLGMPDMMPDLPTTIADALHQSHDLNPDYLSSLHAAKSAKYDIDTNKATLLPQVSLIGSMSRQYGMGVPGKSQFSQDRVGINVAIPLYQSGAEYSRVREAKSIARQRSQQSIDIEQTVDQQVTQSWEQLETAIASIEMREAQVKADETSLEGVRQEQQYGSRTILDVLNAQEEVFAAKTNLVRAQRDRVVAAYNLAFNLGKLTPQSLNLKVDSYDPQEHYDSVKWQPIGF